MWWSQVNKSFVFARQYSFWFSSVRGLPGIKKKEFLDNMAAA
jgi:hypothetical protein